jgi:hypothetical protein
MRLVFQGAQLNAPLSYIEACVRPKSSPIYPFCGSFPVACNQAAKVIGGGPTFLGTILGYFFVSDAMSVLFLSLAAGALVYIVGELFHVNRRPGTRFQVG